MSKINTFTDLIVWQKGHSLVVNIYKVTKTFPREEIYSLIDQMRRSASSITANIAEGFGRHSYREKLRFYYLSQGSLTELKDQILVAQDIRYLNRYDFQLLVNLANETHKLLQGLITKTRSFLSKS